jgi:hypothetical protein
MSSASTAYAGDQGEVSQAQLAELGLGSMQTISGEEGMEIRGQGFRRRNVRFRLTNGSSTITVNIGFLYVKNVYKIPGPLSFP